MGHKGATGGSYCARASLGNSAVMAAASREEGGGRGGREKDVEAERGSRVKLASPSVT